MKKVIYSLFVILAVCCQLTEIYASSASIDDIIAPYKVKPIKTLRTESISGNWKAQFWFGFERDAHETSAMKKEAVKWWANSVQNPSLDNIEAKKILIEKIVSKIEKAKTGYIISMIGSEKDYEKQNQDLMKLVSDGDITAMFKVGFDYYDAHTLGAVRPDIGFTYIREAALKGHQPAIDFLCDKARDLYGVE